MGIRGGVGRAIPVPTHIPSRDPYLAYSSLRTYLRPNEGQFQVNDEVSQIGSRKGPELTRIDPRIDPQMTLLDWSRDGPQMTLR